MHFVDAKHILSPKNGMNIYRGCTHGCIYCDSRSKCYNFSHAFEDIEVKQNAPMLLEKRLRSKREKCMIGTGAMCDPYMHCEEKLGLTRQCLEIIERYGFGLAIQTKSDRILRDLDILQRINEKSKCVVQMTLTTYDEDLCKIIEPNVSTTRERFEALKIFRDHKIPTVVWFSPLLPFINDNRENLEGILECCTKAKVYGIINYGIGVTLREGDREYFYDALDRFFPGMRKRYHDKYGYAYEIYSDHNEELMLLFKKICQERKIEYNTKEIFNFMNAYPKDQFQQLSLF